MKEEEPKESILLLPLYICLELTSSTRNILSVLSLTWIGLAIFLFGPPDPPIPITIIIMLIVTPFIIIIIGWLAHVLLPNPQRHCPRNRDRAGRRAQRQAKQFPPRSKKK